MIAALPEYSVVKEIFSVGLALDPDLLAEIGAMHRFHSKKTLVAFSSNGEPSCQSGKMDIRSCNISKQGFAALRRT